MANHRQYNINYYINMLKRFLNTVRRLTLNENSYQAIQQINNSFNDISGIVSSYRGRDQIYNSYIIKCNKLIAITGLNISNQGKIIRIQQLFINNFI